MNSLPQNIIPMKDYRDAREQPVLRDDLCIQCGQPTDAHFSVNGRKQDCAFALRYAELQTRHPQVWNDPYPAVTCAVRAALLLQCGPEMQTLIETLPHDVVLGIAHTAGKAAIAAYVAELAK